MTRRIALLPALLLVLNGCGYHLRGSTGESWNLGRVYIQHEGTGGLSYEVQRLLVLGDVTFARSAAQADTIVSFVREDQERRVLSVDPRTGKVREYELIMEAVLRVTQPTGKVLIDDDSVVLQRDYVFDETVALAEYAEETTLFRELREDMAAAVLRRLQALNARSVGAAPLSPEPR
ncbi:MAG: LPS-assembly lipoprotein LptE [Chromatiales bacterium]